MSMPLSKTRRDSQKPKRRHRRTGKVLLLFLISLPALLGLIGLVFDYGLMSGQHAKIQHAADAAALAAALEYKAGNAFSDSDATAKNYVQLYNNLPSATVSLQTPPLSGNYAGKQGYFQVNVKKTYDTIFMRLLGSESTTVEALSVAGCKDATAGVAVMVLDPKPPRIAIAPTPLLLTSFPALLGGLEVLGLGEVKIDGAVVVNNQWGGLDEEGNHVGDNFGPPFAVSCTPLINLTRVKARDVRVSGGVDNPNSFANYSGGGSMPLRANRAIVPDPYKNLPVPTVAADGINVKTQLRGSVTVLQLPILVPPAVLSPGVYEWIEVIAGEVIFQPGVYVIRNVNPLTKMALNIAGGIVQAEGVMFYITDTANYSCNSGLPDLLDKELKPSPPPLLEMLPSVLINAALPGSRFSGITTANSPFAGMFIYQRRHDYRPVVIAHQSLLGNASFSGAVYAKWGHVLMLGNGTYDLTLAGGTVRLLTVLNMTIKPSKLLPAVKEVYMVE